MGTIPASVVGNVAQAVEQGVTRNLRLERIAFAHAAHGIAAAQALGESQRAAVDAYHDSSAKGLPNVKLSITKCDRYQQVVFRLCMERASRLLQDAEEHGGCGRGGHEHRGGEQLPGGAFLPAAPAGGPQRALPAPHAVQRRSLAPPHADRYPGHQAQCRHAGALASPSWLKDCCGKACVGRRTESAGAVQLRRQLALLEFWLGALVAMLGSAKGIVAVVCGHALAGFLWHNTGLGMPKYLRSRLSGAARAFRAAAMRGEHSKPDAAGQLVADCLPNSVKADANTLAWLLATDPAANDFDSAAKADPASLTQQVLFDVQRHALEVVMGDASSNMWLNLGPKALHKKHLCLMVFCSARGLALVASALGTRAAPRTCKTLLGNLLNNQTQRLPGVARPTVAEQTNSLLLAMECAPPCAIPDTMRSESEFARSGDTGLDVLARPGGPPLKPKSLHELRDVQRGVLAGPQTFGDYGMPVATMFSLPGGIDATWARAALSDNDAELAADFTPEVQRAMRTLGGPYEHLRAGRADHKAYTATGGPAKAAAGSVTPGCEDMDLLLLRSAAARKMPLLHFSCDGGMDQDWVLRTEGLCPRCRDSVCCVCNA